MSICNLEEEYSIECNKMSRLGHFSPSLNKVYIVTEAKWEENVQRLLHYGTNIKYLMIGEAAPAQSNDTVNYFYNNCNGNWCNAIVEGIIPWQELPYNTEAKLDELARRQFLLVDTMPFAIDYSATKLRQKKEYVELVKLFFYSYLQKKLFDPRLKWDSTVRVAFGVKKNAEAMKIAFPNGFKLPNNQIINVSMDLVATTTANYPSAGRVREVFGITF